jgi:hypothetical protein
MTTGMTTGRLDAVTGAMLGALTLAVLGREWMGWPVFDYLSAGLAVLVLLAMAPVSARQQKVFAGVGAALLVAVAATRPDWPAWLLEAGVKAAFIAGFYTALTSLRHVADRAEVITRCGDFLTAQPPGRRYAALTGGGLVFALLLSYGAIALLGSLSVRSAATEPDPELRGHRTRRMLLAVQRGFASSLTWSPLAFAIAVSLSMVPGADWLDVALPSLGAGAILLVLGWALDTLFKPRLSRPPPPRRAAPEGGWHLLLPLLGLLVILGGVSGLLQLLGGVRYVAAVMLAVPVISLGWLALQSPGRRLRGPLARGGDYLLRTLPGYRGELVLLMMAGFIGTMGAALLVPLIEASGLDLRGVPSWAVLLALVWGIPLAGQIGANPILAVTLVAPVLPPAAEMGLTPADLVVAMTAGWSLTAATSPYTASTLLIARLGGVPARHVGLVWNGGFVAAGLVLMSAWVLAMAAL